MKLETRPRDSSLQITEIQKGDVLLAEVGVSNMPPTRASEYCLEVRNGLRSMLGEDLKIMVLPQREQRDVVLSVIRMV